MDAETFWYILLIVCLLLMDSMFCGFIAMIHSISGTDIDKNEQELGPKLAGKLRHINDNEIAYENRGLIAIVVTTAVWGAVGIPRILLWSCDFILTNYETLPVLYKKYRRNCSVACFL